MKFEVGKTYTYTLGKTFVATVIKFDKKGIAIGRFADGSEGRMRNISISPWKEVEL